MIKIGLTDFTPADKIIEIRDNKEVIKAKYAISATDILKCTLMNEHYIEISFQYNRYVAFKRSDYILWNGSKYTLREDYIPEQINKRKFDYTLKFEAVEMLFQDIQYYYLNQSLKESEWRLAGNPEYFIKIAVDNANRYFKVADFQIGVIEPTEIKDIIFDTNTNTFDALTQIAEDYESEWYMTGKTINLVKKVSFGAEVDFETEVSILSMSRSEGENSKKYTRILALGSERNLPKDYRGSLTGEGVDAVYPKRLRIPAAKGDVIDAYPNMSPDEVVEGTVIFDEVYPKRVGTIQDVGTIEYTDTDEDTGEVTKWNAFKIKDSGINFKEEYLLPGVELRLSMQSGDLNGFDFALKFHKDGFSKTDNSQYFEIVRSEDYGKKLPNDTMKPKAGDKYVLYGFNIALVSDQYVPAGEQELFDTASAWLQKQLQDTSVYECPTVIDHFKKNEMDLEIGQKVRLVKDIGSSRNLILKSDVIVDVSQPSNSYLLRGWNVNSKGIELGDKITLTVKITVFKDYTAQCWFQSFLASSINFATGKDETIIKSITIDATSLTVGTATIRAYNYRYASTTEEREGNRFILHWIKLEKGNKATDWSPAPEDVEGAIRSSRIMGYEKKLYNIYDAKYTVGDNSAYSRLSAIEKDLKELQYAGLVYENTGSGNVYLIKQFDTTTPSDHNAYSAKASDAKYFNKQTGGTVQGDTLFQKNMQVQGSAISDVFQNSTFTAGQFGSGFQIKRDANGQSYIEVDNLMVRRETVFNKLTIAEIKSVGGSILLSLANMVISKVEDKTSAWRCYFDNSDGTIPNDFAVNDQVICRKFTGNNIKYYWSRVTSVGLTFIEISKTDKDGTGVPAIHDEVIQLGNRADVNRQYAIILSAYGSDAPSIKQYAGINSYDLTGKEVTVISPEGNKFSGAFTVSTNGTTSPVYKERGAFVNGTVYYLNDRVSFLGSHWVCVANSTITTPSETSSTWRKETAGESDIQNIVDKGLDSIEVGGINLFKGSKNTRYIWSQDNNGLGGKVTYETNPEGFMESTFTSTGLDLSRSYCYLFIQDFISEFPEANQDYTISFDYKTNNECGFSCTIRNPLITHRVELSNTDGEWKRGHLVVNFNVTNQTRINLSLLTTVGEGNYISVRKIKIERGNKATDWTPAPEDIEAEIIKAQQSADNANLLLNDISSDNKLTPLEKTELLREWESIVAEYSNNVDIAYYTQVSTTTYVDAYSKLQQFVIPLFSNMNETSLIVGSTLRNLFKKYYSERSFLLSSISGNTKDAVDRAQWEAEQVRREYKSDFKILDDQISSKVSQTDFNALGSRVATAESNIIQQAGQIELTVEKVENLQVGSRNYMRNSKVGRFAFFTNNGTTAPISFGQEADGTWYVWSTNNTHISLYSMVALDSLTVPLDNAVQEIMCSISIQVEKATTITFGSNTFNLEANKWTRVSSVIAPYLRKYILAFSTPDDFGSARLYYKEYKVELGNKATDWTPAPEDAHRSYYQDDTPAVPSGGHNVGDMWYMLSMVDYDGNINADASKNIYQLQRRWNGSAWSRINWSVSRSKITQTDSSITSIVEKTGVGNLGNDETLYSKIDQTASQITLQVSNIKVGGRNLFHSNTDMWFVLSGGVLINRENNGFTVQADSGTPEIRLSKVINSQGWYTVSGYVRTNQTGYRTMRIQFNDGAWKAYQVNFQESYFEYSVEVNNYSAGTYNFVDFQLYAAAVFYFRDIKVEKGNKATDWSPAPEDVQSQIDGKTTLDDVKAGLSIEADGVTMFGQKFTVNSLLIAQAIEAGSLNIGNGNFFVGQDGKISAKGANIDGKISSNSVGERIMIDPNDRSLKMIDSLGTVLAQLSYYAQDGNKGASLTLKGIYGGKETTIIIDNSKILVRQGDDYTLIGSSGFTIKKGDKTSVISDSTMALAASDIIWENIPESDAMLAPKRMWVDNAGYLRLKK